MYYGGFGMGYYTSMIVLIPAIIFSVYCQAKIKNAYGRYSKIANSRGYTGAQAAEIMMRANGLPIAINILNGNALTNYYNPKDKTLNLSKEVYSSSSVAAICIACHEVGHAIQDASGYSALRVRNSIVPVVNLTQTLSWPLIIIGMIFSSTSPQGSLLFNIGVICFCVVIVFHLVTLPVEFNASNRALAQLTELNIASDSDMIGCNKVLKAAAMTYVAALATAVANLLRILLMANRRN